MTDPVNEDDMTADEYLARTGKAPFAPGVYPGLYWGAETDTDPNDPASGAMLLPAAVFDRLPEPTTYPNVKRYDSCTDALAAFRRAFEAAVAAGWFPADETPAGRNRIVTRSGRRIGPDYGVPSLRDVVLSHCRTPMFAGHTGDFYSVAHHCVAAAEIAEECGEEVVAYFALLHEAEVSLYGDVPGPVKTRGQRAREAAFRRRFFADLGTPLPEKVWDRVEFFDKIEQAAAAMTVGLGEGATVHQAVWTNAPAGIKSTALAVVARNLDAYPPRDQLGSRSPLLALFLRMAERGRRVYARERP